MAAAAGSSSAQVRDKLDAVNKEMDAIMQHNENVRTALCEAERRGPASYAALLETKVGRLGSGYAAVQYADPLLGWGGACPNAPFNGGHHGGGAGPSSAHYTGGGSMMHTPQDALRREVRDVVAAEMEAHRVAFEQRLVKEWELRVREVDQSLKGRFSELRSANETLQRAVVELNDHLSHSINENAARLDRLENDMSRKIAAVKRETAEEAKRLRGELQDLSEVLSDAKVDAGSLERRAEELAQKQQQSTQEAFRQFENKWAAVEDELHGMLRAERRAHHDAGDAVRADVKALQDRVKGLGGALAAAAEQVGSASSDAVAMRSQMRTCRSDIHQLELLVRSMAVRQQHLQAAASAAAKGQPLPPNEHLAAAVAAGDMHLFAPYAAGTAVGSSGSVGLADQHAIRQDVYALKQCVSYLADVIERNMGTTAATTTSVHRNRAGDDSPETVHVPSFIRRNIGSPTKYPIPSDDSEEDINAKLARSSLN